MSRASADLVEYGCCWIRDHPKTSRRLMHLVHMQVDSGRVMQRGNVYTLAMQSGMSVSGVDELRRDHNLWSVLARYMVMLRPRLARALSFRRSPIDDIDMVGRWHEIVNPSTLFLADSWRDAKKAVEAEDVSAV